ncbi:MULTISPECIES: nitroreductase/quinone reductase family protein [Actinomadura]|uniref:Nitroreductase/quinone reductase family protein n=1 Tax=Actinomadura yumaensis TaxID=111807 RepID=A0ABW2CW97_9ACTN|nr:nitroreductase/quinone reductase family protein [Actinomadura sp. J1-007]MWK35314.1 DUF385 domain-containing protein [Actinomadura sp. J1-007]
MTATAAPRYIETVGVEVYLHKAVAFLARRGISLFGTRVLAVRGRTSGEWRTNPVNVLTVDGERYLVAPRGHTQWVRNLRVAGDGELRLGRSAEPFTATELTGDDKLPILRAYVARWGWELGRFFEGLTKDSTDAELAAVAHDFPAFKLN